MHVEHFGNKIVLLLHDRNTCSDESARSWDMTRDNTVLQCMGSTRVPTREYRREQE